MSFSTLKVLNYKIHKPVPAGAIYVGRANKYGCSGVFGNNHTPGPCRSCSDKFRIKVEHTGEACLAIYRSEILRRIVNEKGFAKGFLTLRGKQLVCGCVKKDGTGPCHAWILVEIRDALPEGATEADLIAFAVSEIERPAAEPAEVDHG